MITDVMTYVLHIAPSLGVAIALLLWMEKRMATREQYIETLLTECWSRLINHLDK